MTPDDKFARLVFGMKILSAIIVCVATLPVLALEYAYAPYHDGKMDPQKGEDFQL